MTIPNYYIFNRNRRDCDLFFCSCRSVTILALNYDIFIIVHAQNGPDVPSVGIVFRASIFAAVEVQITHY